MSRIVDDLMLLARARRPDFLRIEELDLDLLTHEIFANAVTLGDRDWRLEHTGVGTMSADRQRLTQAVINLAENAVQHTSPGDSIVLGTALSPDEVRMWVRDTGPGIDEAEREKMFDRFSTSSSAANPDSRLGLGLAIVKAIAEAHGGSVAVANTPDEGATFAIDRPRAGGGPEGRHVSRILVAEDEPRLSEFLEKGLRSSGFATTVVADGTGAPRCSPASTTSTS